MFKTTSNSKHARVALGVTASALCLLAPSSSSRLANAFPPPPASFDIPVTIRDFRAWDEPGGQSDMQRGNCPMPGGGGLYQGNMVEHDLGADGKPVFKDGASYHVTNYWYDAGGNEIAEEFSAQFPPVNPPMPDTPGTTVDPAVHGCNINGYVTSAATFAQWFEDDLSLNQAIPVTLTFTRQGSIYVFDSSTDEPYQTLGGFFPVDGLGWGNYTGGALDHNYHFTMELHASFEYVAADDPVLTFVGDDDMYAFINGKLVISIGGHHYPRPQHVQLARLGLADGDTYALDIFYAERRTNGSNCRITTTMPLVGADPSISAPFD